MKTSGTDALHYTPGKVAVLLGVSHDTILRHIKRGHLRAVNVGTGDKPVWRIDAESYEQFRAERGNEISERAEARRQQKARRRRWV